MTTNTLQPVAESLVLSEIAFCAGPVELLRNSDHAASSSFRNALASAGELLMFETSSERPFDVSFNTNFECVASWPENLSLGMQSASP